MSDRWRVHTIVLDVDDTLYFERDYVVSGFSAVDAWLRTDRGLQGFGELASRRFERGRRGTIFDETLQDMGINPDADLIGQMVRVYREHAPALRLADDAEAVLPWLREHFKLAALTDGYATVQRKKFAALDLSRWIELCVVTDELGREFWKPHPAGFEQIMAHIGGDAVGFVYVADNPHKDFIAPRSLDWRTVRIRRTGGEHADYEPQPHETAEREIGSLIELKQLFATST